MNKKTKKAAISYSAILILIIILLLEFLTSQIESIDISPLIRLLSLFIVAAVYMLAFYIVAKYYNKVVVDKVSAILCDTKKPKDVLSTNSNLCKYHGYYCCADTIINSEYYSRIVGTLKLTETDCNKYNLLTDDAFDDMERKFFINHTNGEIWVVSNALETVVRTPEENREKSDGYHTQSMSIVENNIRKGGKYIQFVALGSQGEDITFINRRNLYWAVIDTKSEYEKKKRLPIIRIDDAFLHHNRGRNRVSDPDMNYMVKLTSTILFINYFENGQLSVDGYFCLRPDEDKKALDYEKRTVYYKMPKCLQSDYYNFLNKKKLNYLKNMEDKLQ